MKCTILKYQTRNKAHCGSSTITLLLQANWRSGHWCCTAPLCTHTSCEVKSLALQRQLPTPTRSSQRSTTVRDQPPTRVATVAAFWKLPFLLPQVTSSEIIKCCRCRTLRSRVQRTRLRRSWTPSLHQLPPLLPQVQKQHQVRGWRQIRQHV